MSDPLKNLIRAINKRTAANKALNDAKKAWANAIVKDALSSVGANEVLITPTGEPDWDRMRKRYRARTYPVNCGICYMGAPRVVLANYPLAVGGTFQEVTPFVYIDQQAARLIFRGNDHGRHDLLFPPHEEDEQQRRPAEEQQSPAASTQTCTDRER